MPITLHGATPDDQLRILEIGHELVMEGIYLANQRWEECGRPHLHPCQDEYFEILEGMLSVRVANEERTYVAGETFKFLKGTPHRMCNLSRKPAHIRWKVRPAMNTAIFLETAYQLNREGMMDSLLQQAVIAWAYRDIYKPLSHPLWIQPLVFAPLALVGRLLGYKARYPHEELERRLT
jgi:hypothetical protein